MPDAHNPLGRGSQTGRPLLSAFFGFGALIAGVVYPLTNGQPQMSLMVIAWGAGIALGIVMAFVPGVVATVMLIGLFVTGQFLARTLLGDSGYASPAGWFMIAAATLTFAAKDLRAAKTGTGTSTTH